MAGHVDGEDYQLVEISNPDLLLVKGAPEDHVLDACKELTHVQSVLVFSMFCCKAYMIKYFNSELLSVLRVNDLR